MRNSPHIWKSFWSLNVDEWFFIGKRMHQKKSFCKARRSMEDGLVSVAPWRRVRTMIPVAKTGRLVTNHNIQAAIDGGKYWPRAKDCFTSDIRQAIATTGCRHEPAASEIQAKENLDQILAVANTMGINPGKTHYVGDSCPGGHAGEMGEPGHPDNPVFCQEKPLRDPMAQDHTPDQVPTHERTSTTS